MAEAAGGHPTAEGSTRASQVNMTEEGAEGGGGRKKKKAAAVASFFPFATATEGGRRPA